MFVLGCQVERFLGYMMIFWVFLVSLFYIEDVFFLFLRIIDGYVRI